MDTDYVFDLSDLKCSASTVILTKRVADKLEKHYPGWAWAVQPDERGGVLNIFSLKLSGEWGYRFLLKDIQGDPRACDPLFVKAGGEILERFGVPRSGYRYEHWKGTVKDISGVAKADITDKPRAMQRRQRDNALTDALNNGLARLKVMDTPTATGTHREIAIQLGGSDGHE